MLAYVQAFINIALLRTGPEDLPDSRFLLGLTLAIYVVTQFPLALIDYGLGFTFVRMVAASLLIVFGGLWVLLVLTGHQSRYRRTVTAMLGTSALLTALSIPFNAWLQAALEEGSGVAAPTTMMLAIMLWSIAIDGHIFSRALSRPYGIGLFIAVAYFFLHMTILFELRPDGIGGQPG